MQVPRKSPKKPIPRGRAFYPAHKGQIDSQSGEFRNRYGNNIVSLLDACRDSHSMLGTLVEDAKILDLIKAMNRNNPSEVAKIIRGMRQTLDRKAKTSLVPLERKGCRVWVSRLMQIQNNPSLLIQADKEMQR